MSARRLAQRALDLGPATHFDMLHGRHRHEVALATKPQGWQCFNHHFTHPHDIARRLVVEYAPQDADCYLSQNGFTGHRRVADVAALTSLYVDLDTYNVPELSGMPPDALLEHVMGAHPWLPPPTLLASSGRGAYFVWVLSEPLPPPRLPDWQEIEVELVALLAPFGADAAAKDASRILRVCSSLNNKSGQRVWYKQVHDTVRFAELAGAVRKHCLKPVKRAPRPAHKPRVVSGGVTRLWSGYSLAHGRMLDLEQLAGMRGPLDDCRHRFLYCYAVAAAWYCPTVDVLVDELDGFSERHFIDARKYQGRARCSTVIERLKQAREGKTHQWRGEQVDPRYRMQTRTIIRLLDITDSEQASMRVIIGREEKARRKRKHNEKRYDRRRNEYLAEQAAQTERRRQTALELLGTGMSKSAVAQALGVHRRRVYQLLEQSV